MAYETEHIEFKELHTDELYKEVIAFANTDGGTIYIGVNDQGETVGLKDVDEAYTRITNGIRDAILPDVTIFIRYTLEDKKIIRIEVGEGSYKPYYLKSKGLKPSGVYVRQGTSSVQASPEQIRQMIKDADGDIFEDMRSMEQELTFRDAADVFQRHGLEFDEKKYDVIGIRSRNQGLYTNLGLLLSDQCPHTIKAAVFSDPQNTNFQDRKEFSGSLFRQLEDAYAYLQLCNRNRAVIDGLERKDFWDYPKEAIREGLLNALVHRDYSFSGSIITNVNEAGVEFISLGGLTGGLTAADLRNGVSLPRNRKLANVFHRMNFIEAYGTGIRRIFTLYQNCSRQPELDVAPNSFRLFLPNMNYSDGETVRLNSAMSSQAQKVTDYLREHGNLTTEGLQELLNIKRTRAYTLAKQMEQAGLIRINGRGTNRTYTIV